MESWRKVWRDGFQASFSTEGLISLRGALLEDSQLLLQGATTKPPPLMCVIDWPTEACCPVSWASSEYPIGERLGHVEENFARACFEADQRLGAPAACRWFLNWWDDSPRQTAILELLSEVELELSNRGSHEGLQGQGVHQTQPEQLRSSDIDCPF